MAYLKPQTPIQLNENYIYPLTTADQVITTTGERLNSLFKKTIKETATLQAANWSDTLPYIQTITISESTDDYNVDANIVYSGNKADTELNKAASCLTYVKKSGKNIIFYCLKEKPEVDIPVEITGTCRNTIATVEEGIKLNFDIVGNPRPKTGDTLYWDGNTEGLLTYMSWIKISDVIVTNEELSDGFLDGDYHYKSDEILEFNGATIVPPNIGIYVFIPQPNFDMTELMGSNFIFPEPGIYILTSRTGDLTLRIPGFTGFEKDDIEVKENTIWVDTDVPITGYKFSATEPEEPVDGMVWIKTGDDSSVAFDIVEGAKMYPLSVKQYVSGVWINKVAKSYQNGEWVEWITYLFDYGKQEYNWISKGWYHSDTSQSKIAPTTTINADGSVTLSMSVSDGATPSGGYEITEDIDFTNIDMLKIEYDILQTGNYRDMYLVIIKRGSTYYANDAAILQSIGSSVISNAITEIDTSELSGMFSIAVCLSINGSRTSGTISGTIKRIMVQ